MARSSGRRPRGGAAQFIVRPLLAALVASGVVAPAGVHAATIVVTTGGDAGTAATCTLRQAVVALNTASLAGTACLNSGAGFGSSDTIDLTPQAGTITLAGATEIGWSVPMTIAGPGSGALTVSGANASRVFATLGPPTALAINDLTIANGRAAGPGGCIFGGAISLTNAVVTGCTALHSSTFPSDPANYLNGIGGGISAYAVEMNHSTVSGNIAEVAGGGVFAKYVRAYDSVIANNTVSGRACTVVSSSKYCAPLLFGGGGMMVGAAQLVNTAVSGNTVYASALTGVGPPGTYNFGVGGGITQINKYTPEVAAAAAKSTIVGRGDVASRAAARAALRASAGAKSLTRAKGGARAKADGYGNYIVALYASTVSGNRVVGNGLNPGKYAGGGIIAYSEYYTAEIANSTISGNRLPQPAGPDPYPTMGAALFADSAEISNSTITGNAGTVAVAFKYRDPVAAVAASKSAGAKAAIALDRIRAKAAQWRGAGAKAAVAKAAGPSALYSTIVGGNSAPYDVVCLDPCVVGGSNNLVQAPDPGTTLPGDTITGQNPQLAPLVNNGGVVAGAPGHLLTGPVPTHRLYIGSPAINAGANPESFAYEQRGPGFPRVVGSAADIGATEGSIARPVSVPVPVLGPWMLGLLSALLGALGLLRRRRPS